jgi:two-component system, LytTR family, response regulator
VADGRVRGADLMLRTVVVDDEALARRRVCELVDAHPELERVGEASDGAGALDVIVDLRPDLVFLDIQMPELDGFEVLAALDEDDVPAVVFVTAYDEHALRAFDVGAFDYLLKPVTPERFEAAVARVRDRTTSGEAPRRARDLASRMERERGWARRLVTRTGNRHAFVPVGEINWIEADGNYARVHVGTRTHLVRVTMRDLEARLDPDDFVRIHRSTIVAIDRIGSIRIGESGEWEVTMAKGERLATSRSYADRVRALLR